MQIYIFFLEGESPALRVLATKSFGITVPFCFDFYELAKLAELAEGT